MASELTRARVSSRQSCRKCGSNNFGSSTSSTTGRVAYYCRPCRGRRAELYRQRRSQNGGKHTRRQWLELLQTVETCPGCHRRWSEIPPRPDRRFRYVWTKDHVIPVSAGGTDDIDNLQPLCYHCQFSKGARYEVKI
ncbi:HNH endonuclease [Deinococcus sp. HMF7604]|uniref:HNH endonuclease signature motif containing protein n=1 Tax=Deinococcus betulae TaxID=2873312 RepID=UPI001CC95309|nr:HNH endonuclease [Deinococcus betulae]